MRKDVGSYHTVRLLTSMLWAKRDSIVIYCHNLSSFDGYFILKSLASAGIQVDILKRDAEIFYIKANVKSIKVEFRCSLLLLRQSLESYYDNHWSLTTTIIGVLLRQSLESTQASHGP